MQNVSISSTQNGDFFTINIEGITKEEMRFLTELIPIDREKQVPFILSLLGMALDAELM